MEDICGIVGRLHPHLEGEIAAAELDGVIGFLGVVVGAVKQCSLTLLAVNGLGCGADSGSLTVDMVGGCGPCVVKREICERSQHEGTVDLQLDLEGGLVAVGCAGGCDGDSIVALVNGLA